MFVCQLRTDDKADPWLLSEPEEDKVSSQTLLTVYIPRHECDLRVHRVVVQLKSQDDVPGSFGRQTSTPSLSLKPVPMQRQVSLQATESGSETLTARAIGIGRTRIKGNESGSFGWTLDVPRPGPLDQSITDYKPQNVFNAPHCSLTLSLQDDSAVEAGVEEEEPIVVEIPLASTPLNETPRRMRHVFLFKDRRGFEFLPGMISTVWSTWAAQLVQDPEPSRAIWNMVWTIGLLMTSAVQNEGTFRSTVTGRDAMVSALNALSFAANSTLKAKPGASDRIAVAFGASAAHIIRHMNNLGLQKSKCLDEEDQPSFKLLTILPCLPLNTNVLLHVRQLLTEKFRDDLQGNHLTRLFKEGIVALMKVDADSFPIASFHSIRCGVYLDVIFNQAADKDVSALKQVSAGASRKETELRQHLNGVEAALNKVMDRMTTRAFYNPEDAGEMFNTVSEERVKLVKQLSKCRKLMRHLGNMDDAYRKLDAYGLDETLLGRARAQLHDVTSHLRRKSENMEGFFRLFFQRTVVARPRGLDNIEPPSAAVPYIAQFRPQGITNPPTTQTPQQQRAFLPQQGVAYVRGSSPNQGQTASNGELFIVRLLTPTHILFCSPRLQLRQAIALQSIVHEQILMHPHMEICCLSGSAESEHDLLLCTKYTAVLQGKKATEATGVATTLLVFRLRFYEFNHNLVVTEVRTAVKNSRTVTDASCVGDFSNGTIIVAARNLPQMFLLPARPAASQESADGLVSAVKTMDESLVRTINPRALEQSTDGPIALASLDSPVMCMVHCIAEDRILFASSKRETDLLVRDVDSKGTVRTVARCASGSVLQRLRFTALVPHLVADENNANDDDDGQQPCIYGMCVDADSQQHVQFKFFKVGDGLYSLADRIVKTAQQAESALPSHVSFVPDREHMSYACGFFPLPTENNNIAAALGVLSTGVTEARAKKAWARELLAWEPAKNEFLDRARDLAKEMSNAYTDLHRLETTVIAVRLQAETSKAFWTALDLGFPGTAVADYFGVCLHAAPSLTDVAKLYRKVLASNVDTSRTQKSTAPHLSEALSTWVDLYPWPESALEQDLASLIDMVQTGSGIISDHTLARVFGSKNFYCPLPVGMELLMASLNSTGWDQRDLFRLPVVHWLNRIDPESAAQRPLPAFTSLKRTFTYWEQLFANPHVSPSVKPAMEWLCIAHFRTVAARKVSSIRALVHLDSTTATESTVKQLLLRNLVQIFGSAEMYQSSSGSSGSSTSTATVSLLQAVTLDRIGMLRCNIWREEPSLEFYSKGVLPQGSNGEKSIMAQNVLAEPIVQLSWFQMDEEECANESEEPTTKKGDNAQSFILEARGCFEAAASGTYVFAWVPGPASASSSSGAAKTGVMGAMWLGIASSSSSSQASSGNGGGGSVDPYAGIGYKYAKLNQPLVIDLSEGEHFIAVRAFSRLPDVRLAVEGPYTAQAAKDRLEMPLAAKRLPYPIAACLFCPRDIAEVVGGGPSHSTQASAQITWTLLRSMLQARADAEKVAAAGPGGGGNKRKFADVAEIKSHQDDVEEGDAIKKRERYPALLSAERFLFSKSKVVNELLEFGLDNCELLLGCFGGTSVDQGGDGPLYQFLHRVKSQLTVILACLQEDQLTTAQLDRLGLHKFAFVQSLVSAGLATSDDDQQVILSRVDLAQAESLTLFQALERLSSLLSSFAENVEDGDELEAEQETGGKGEEKEESFSSKVESLLRSFKKTPLGDVRQFLSVSVAPALRPGSEPFVFLERVHDSSFFKRLWDRSFEMAKKVAQEKDVVGVIMGKRTERTFEEWSRLRGRIISGEVTWNELELLEVHRFKGDLRQEMKRFLQLDSANVDSDKYLDLLDQWMVLSLVSDGWQRAIRCVPLLAALVAPSAEQAKAKDILEEVLRAAGEVLTKMSMEDRHALTLAACAAIAQSTKVVETLQPGATLLRLEEELCDALAQSLPLMLWLRKTKSDAEFASSIEMAFTKPELQVPQDLWNHEKNCVDETILGYLADVRTSLHELIFGVDELPVETFRMLFEALQETCVRQSASSSELTDRLRTVNAKRRQLMQLLAGDEPTTQESHNQLLFLQSCQAEWVCSSKEELSMQYTVAVEGAESVLKRLDRETLADLQSTLVLGAAQTHEDDFVADLANAFVEELTTFDMVLDCAQRLRKAGHLTFQEFEIRVAFGKDTDQLRLAWNDLDMLVREWEDTFARFRQSFPLLSCFTNRQIVEFVSLLLKINGHELPRPNELIALPAAGRSAARNTLNAETATNREENADLVAMRLLACRDPDVADAQVFARLWSECKREFTLNDKTGKVDPTEALSACGRALSNAIAKLTPKVNTRLVDVSHLSLAESARNMLFPASSSSQSTSSVVKVVRVASPSKLVDMALTAYAIAGRFPSRQDCSFCGPFVSSDSALNLVRRWQGEEDANALYCLIGPNTLSFDHQREVGKALEAVMVESTKQKRPTGRKCPFLIIVASSSSSGSSSSKEESAIETMFASTGRIALVPLPVTTLRQFVKDGLASRGVTAMCVSSKLPGQGKSFQIRRRANGQPMHVFRINAILSLDFLINLARGTGNENNGTNVVHVDISDSAARSTGLSALLFDYIFLNGIVDESSGNSCIWTSSIKHNPRTLFVEIPSKAPTSELRLCRFLDPVDVVPSPDSFVIDFEQLKLGMGAEDFFSTRFDGTVESRFRSLNEPAVVGMMH